MRRLVAFLVSLMLLLPAGSVSAQAFFCNMRGSVMSKCCCGEKRAAERSAGDQDDSASQGACCDELTLAAAAQQRNVGTTDDAAMVPAAVILAVLPEEIWTDVPRERVERASARARAPPPATHAPLFILHRAFLS